MKVGLPLLVFLFICSLVIGQETETRYRTERKSYYPPLPSVTSNRLPDKGSPDPATSFTVSSVGQGGGTPTASPENGQSNYLKDIPVNAYTGTPQVQIPLYTLSNGKLSLPLYLNYNSSGIRAGEVSSWVGLGWNLEGVPTLTRQARGLPDEGKADIVGNTRFIRKGFFRYGNQVASGSMSNDDDNEPDWYFLNLGGAAYKFMFDANRKAHFFPETDIDVKVEWINESNLDNIIIYFTKFTFTLADGTKYIFTSPLGPFSSNVRDVSCEVEAIAGNKANFQNENYYVSNKVVTGWKIDKIQDPYGAEINFTHAASYYSYYKLAENETNNVCGTPTKQLNRVFIETTRIVKIETEHTGISFLGNNRQDVDGFYNALPQGQNTTAPKLSLIQVYDKSNQSAPLNWTFDHGYFTGTSNGGSDLPGSYTYAQVGETHKKRLKLDRVTFPDNTTTTFDYFGQETSFNFKTRFSYGVDHWGYLNGFDSNISGMGLIGKDEVSGTCGSNRESNFSFMKYGILEKMTSSSGMETAFTFEAHRAANYLNGAADMGGLRIKKITYNDRIRNLTSSKNYEYTDGANPSGFLIMQPIYRFNKDFNDLYSNSALYSYLLNESARAIVSYSKVTEKVADNTGNNITGRQVYSFENPTTQYSINPAAGLPCSTPTSKCYFPEIFHPDHQYRAGNLSKAETFHANTGILSEQNSIFTPGNGIKYDSVYVKRVSRWNGTTYTSIYYQRFNKFRLEEQTSKQYRQNGGGIPVANTVSYDYKDEMPQAYRNTYKGKHQMPVQSTTTDESGVQVITNTKYIADFNFDSYTVTRCESTCFGDPTRFCPDPFCEYDEVVITVPPPGYEARGIYEGLEKHLLSSTVEALVKMDGQAVSASYMSFYPATSPYKTLPEKSYALRNFPKSNFQEAYYNTTNYLMIKDSDYGNQVVSYPVYNTKGMPTKTQTFRGPAAAAQYDATGLLPFRSISNAGKTDSLFNITSYGKVFLGPQKVQSPNGFATNYYYESGIGRLNYTSDQAGRLLEKYTYNTEPSGGVVPVSNISWDQVQRSKTCSGGQLTQRVYVNGLAAGQTASFSTNGGSSWQTANIGSNGYAFTLTPTNVYQEFRARASDATTTVITTNYHASCSTKPPLTWGANNCTNTGGICNFYVSVNNVAIDSHIEFSIDNVNWQRANVGNNGYNVSVPFGSGGVQDFYYRAAEDHSQGDSGFLTRCN